MNKICTDIAQSNKLLELGIDINTADMHYHMIFPDVFANKLPHFAIDAEIGKRNTSNDLPAWSLSALLGLMPFHIIENDVRYGFQMVKGLNKEGEIYKIRYEGYISLVETLIYNNPIDAAFEMVCWLKENNKI